MQGYPGQMGIISNFNQNPVVNMNGSAINGGIGG
jgi:hypothetical protein